MAVILKGVLGNLRGRVGEVYISSRNGKDVICRMPRKSRKKPSAGTESARTKFGYCSVFANKVISMPALKKCWDVNKSSGTKTVTLLISTNMKYVTLTGVSLKCSISPPGFFLPVTAVKKEDTYLLVSLSELNKSFDMLGKESLLSLNLIVSCFDPISSGSDPNKVFTLTKDIPDADYSVPLIIQFNFNQEEHKISAAYRKFNLFIAAVVFNMEGGIEYNSSTYSELIE